MVNNVFNLSKYINEAVVKEILNEIPNNEITDPMYGARTIGFTAGDANNEFMRRLQLNSKQI